MRTEYFLPPDWLTEENIDLNFIEYVWNMLPRRHLPYLETRTVSLTRVPFLSIFPVSAHRLREPNKAKDAEEILFSISPAPKLVFHKTGLPNLFPRM